MIHSLFTIQSPHTNPYKNLAIEEHLLHTVGPRECILYLWQNQHTVVIGRNQNSWKECKINELEQDQGHLVRRLSGGGAVYHDLGNLNFTFLTQKANYNVERQFRIIIKALELVGIEAQKTGRNDILVNGKKVSGNAFYHSGEFFYHHGTLLLNVDIEALSKYLNVSMDKMKSHSVDSVKQRVGNLIDSNDSITVATLNEALMKAFSLEYKCPALPLHIDQLPQEKIHSLEQRYSSWDWNYGRRISFEIELERRFSWGHIQLLINVASGIIEDIQIYSDALDTEFIENLKKAILGSNYHVLELCERISTIPDTESITFLMKEDVCDLIRESIG